MSSEEPQYPIMFDGKPASPVVSPVPSYYSAGEASARRSTSSSSQSHHSEASPIPSHYSADNPTTPNSSAHLVYDEDDEFKEVVHCTPETNKALSLLENAIHGDDSRPETVKALSLLDAVVNEDHSKKPDGGEINMLKSEIDIHRQRSANMRALNLLDVTVMGDQLKPTEKPTGALTVRQAANMNHEKRNQEKMEVKAEFEEDKESYGRPAPGLAVRHQKLAETTRKNWKKMTAEDVRDPETVAGMKNDMDLRREMQAKAKALRLLDGKVSMW